MNKENLLKMADYIETITQESFDMELYRVFDDMWSHKCNTVGCVIGHCTILDDVKNIPIASNNINFLLWSYNFTGFDNKSKEWDFCFSPLWSNYDNTPKGAAKRIRYLVEKGSISQYDLTLFNAPLS